MAGIFSLEDPLEPVEDSATAPELLRNTLAQVPFMSTSSCRTGNRVEGKVKAVVHGQVHTRKVGSGSVRLNRIFPGVLVVVQFRFLPEPGSQPFRHVYISFIPTEDYAPRVREIAPKGRIALYPDDLWNTGLLEGRIFSINGYEEFENSASWSMEENNVHKSGIPPELTVAMLLERDDDDNGEPFRFDVNLSAIVGEGAGESEKCYLLGTLHIDPSAEAIGLDALPPGTSLEDLSGINISNLCQIGPTDSRETLRARGFCECGLRVL